LAFARSRGHSTLDTAPVQLLQAIYGVHRGESSLQPSVALRLVREINQPSDLPPAPDPLSQRELQVLKLLAQGLTNQEIADRRVISEWTVRTHVHNILGKPHLANRTQAALYALREGIAGLDDSSVH
jgi:two-component system, NarL family, response regulator LiaR